MHLKTARPLFPDQEPPAQTTREERACLLLDLCAEFSPEQHEQPAGTRTGRRRVEGDRFRRVRPTPLALQPPAGEEHLCDWLVGGADRCLYLAKERSRARVVGIRVVGSPQEELDEGTLVTILRGDPDNPPPGLVLDEIVPV